MCDVEAGTCPSEQLHGNRKSDSAADWDVELHGKYINSIARWCYYRHILQTNIEKRKTFKKSVDKEMQA